MLNGERILRQLEELVIEVRRDEGGVIRCLALETFIKNARAEGAVTEATLTRCQAHIERVKAKVDSIALEPHDFATGQLADAIESVNIVLAALVEAAEGKTK